MYTYTMKTASKIMGKKRFLSREKTCRQFPSPLRDLSWIVRGSVVAIAPRTDFANTTYIWTRKVKAKTVTRALTQEQYEAFRAAIEANRKVEAVLKRMRQVSEKTLLNTLPGVTKKPRRPSTGKANNRRSNPS